jgi:hypothetical protein
MGGAPFRAIFSKTNLVTQTRSQPTTTAFATTTVLTALILSTLDRRIDSRCIKIKALAD